MRARATPIAASVAVIAIIALAGCEDVGLENRNYPLDQARHRPPDALVQAVHPETRPGPATPGAHAMEAVPVTVAGQMFMAAGVPQRIQEASLRQVGAGAGGTFSAAAWDEPPYDRLYLSHPGGLHVPYLPVYDGGEAPVAGGAAHTSEGGAPAEH